MNLQQRNDTKCIRTSRTAKDAQCMLLLCHRHKQTTRFIWCRHHWIQNSSSYMDQVQVYTLYKAETLQLTHSSLQLTTNNTQSVTSFTPVSDSAKFFSLGSEPFLVRSRLQPRICFRPLGQSGMCHSAWKTDNWVYVVLSMWNQIPNYPRYWKKYYGNRRCTYGLTQLCSEFFWLSLPKLQFGPFPVQFLLLWVQFTDLFHLSPGSIAKWEEINDVLLLTSAQTESQLSVLFCNVLTSCSFLW